jgi:hypothetical protein
MSGFAVEAERIALPRGAFAQSHRTGVTWHGRRITGLSQAPFRAYLYPVCTPAGVPVTAEAPVDHPHHRSIWIGADHLTCHLPFAAAGREEANYNFYVEDVFQGRAPGRIVALEHQVVAEDDHELCLVQTLAWKGPREWGAPEGRTVAIETRTIRVRPGEVANLIDLRSELRAAEWDLTIGPTRHAYIGARVADGLRVVDGGRLIDADGREGGDAVSSGRGPWIDCSGNAPGGRKAGLALFPYPSGRDLAWSVTDWGMLTLNPFARSAETLGLGDVLDVAVRIVVHDGDAAEARIADLYDAFRSEIQE